MKKIAFTVLLLVSFSAFAQKAYEDSIQTLRKEYVERHEVVKGTDKSRMNFYPANKLYRVNAKFQAAGATKWLTFKTSGTKEKVFKVYGSLLFSVGGVDCRLTVYQSQDLMENPAYRNYLFVPFTDATTGKETYHGGRYLDLSASDIRNNMIFLDFNKAYNPYCAYVSGVYNCPIPPAENALSVAIKAGERAFQKQK